MKFGKELKASIVQAWRNKYVRYGLLKTKLKELRKLYDEHNISMNNPHQSVKPETVDLPKLLHTNSALKLTNIEMDTLEKQDSTYHQSRTEYERYMDALKSRPAGGHRRNSTSLESMIEFIHNNQNSNNNLNPSDINDSKDNVHQNSHKYRFSKVAEIVDADLESKMPPFESKLQDIKFKEKEIVLLLEQDIFTVSRFYAQQCQYFAEQHNALILLVGNMCKNQIEVDSQLKKGEEDSFGGDSGARPGLRSQMSRAFSHDTAETLEDSGLEEPSTDIQQKEKQLTSKDIAEQKSNIRVLFRQMYNAVRMLERYRKINEMAFYKITKKHDKNSGRFKELQQITTRLIKTRCNFGNDYFTLFLQKRLEYLYSSYLKPSDQKSSEALERLRHPPSTKEIQTESCIIGLCGGWSIAMLLIAIILVATMYGSFWDNWSVYRSWYMFRASMAMSVYLWLWGCDLWVFQKYQFNHGFIFGADPTTLMRVPHVWNVAAILSVTTMLFTIFFVLAFMFDGIFDVDPEVFGMMNLFCWLLYAVIPFPWIKHTKKFLVKSLGKQIVSPFSTVEFIDFFMADQWTSLFTLVVDLLFSFCYLFTGDFLLSGDEPSPQCDNIKTKAWLSLFKLVPYWIRFWQCIRRARDSHQEEKSTKWHFANAGKYSFAIIVTFINAFHVYYHSDITKILAVGFGAIATCYAYFWDIYKDWGLWRFSKNKHHTLLREELTYPAYSYYIAMVANFVCRIAWAVSLFPASFGVYDITMMHYLKLPLNIAEIARRCMWNLFRIENEHLNNCGDFRVVKDIPIAQDYVSSIKIHFDKSSHVRNDGHSSDDEDACRIELHQIEEEEEVKECTPSVVISTQSKQEAEEDSDDDDVLMQTRNLMEMMPLTQQRTNTISDRQSVVLEPFIKDTSRYITITRANSKIKPKETDHNNASSKQSSESESESISSSVQSQRSNKKKRGYMSLKTHCFEDEEQDSDHNEMKRLKKKKKKKAKRKKKKPKKRKRRRMKRAEGQQNNSTNDASPSSELRTLTIKREKSDETLTHSDGSDSSDSSQNIDLVEIKYKKRANMDATQNNDRNKDRFIRIRGARSPVYSEDSERSESRTWPKRINRSSAIQTRRHAPRKEISENKIRDRRMRNNNKRRITDNATTSTTTTENTTEIIFKKKGGVMLKMSHLTQENLAMMEEEKKKKRDINDIDVLSTTVSTSENYDVLKSRKTTDDESDTEMQYGCGEDEEESMNDRNTKITRVQRQKRKATYSKSTQHAIGLISSTSSSKHTKRNKIVRRRRNAEDEEEDEDWSHEMNDK